MVLSFRKETRRVGAECHDCSECSSTSCICKVHRDCRLNLYNSTEICIRLLLPPGRHPHRFTGTNPKYTPTPRPDYPNSPFYHNSTILPHTMVSDSKSSDTSSPSISTAPLLDDFPPSYDDIATTSSPSYGDNSGSSSSAVAAPSAPPKDTLYLYDGPANPEYLLGKASTPLNVLESIETVKKGKYVYTSDPRLQDGKWSLVQAVLGYHIRPRGVQHVLLRSQQTCRYSMTTICHCALLGHCCLEGGREASADSSYNAL